MSNSLPKETPFEMSQIVVRFSCTTSEHLSSEICTVNRPQQACPALTSCHMTFDPSNCGLCPAGSRALQLQRRQLSASSAWVYPKTHLLADKSIQWKFNKLINMMQGRPVPNSQCVSSSERWQ